MSFLSDVHRAIRTPSPGTNSQNANTGTCKEYPRMPRIELARDLEIETSLSEALKKRHSYTKLGSRSLLTLNEISSLLGNALSAHEGSVRRRYPSGGGLFPIETYLCGPIVEGFQDAVFHYHPIKHVLEHLWNQKEPFEFYDYVLSIVPKGSALIVFTSVWDRTSAKYGNLGYSHSLIEAGHMAQNVLLCANALNIEARPVAGFFDEKIEQLLDINPSYEQIVYVISIAGKSA